MHKQIKNIWVLLLFWSISQISNAQLTKNNNTYLIILRNQQDSIQLEEDPELTSQKAAQKAILDESLEPYFSQLQIREIETFVQKKCPTDNLEEAREFARLEFSKAVLPFTEQEIKCLKFVISEINRILMKNNLGLMARQDWKFIKIDNWLCGGFAHTRGDYIILSQRHINHLLQSCTNSISNSELKKMLTGIGSLIVHEQTHCLQRNYPKRFEKLNSKYWNFIQADITAHDEILLNQVSNPDAPNPEWLIPNPTNSSQYFWVRTLLKKGVDLPTMGKDFEEAVFKLEKRNSKYDLLFSEDGKLLKFTLNDIPFYSQSFPVERGIDHPNEIAAYMFADYFKALVMEVKPFQDIEKPAKKNTKSFFKWIKAEMK